MPSINFTYYPRIRRLVKVTTMSAIPYGSVQKMSARNNVCRKALLEAVEWHIRNLFNVTVTVVSP